MRSNVAVAQELDRILQYLDVPPAPSCRNRACDKHGVAIESEPGNYVQFGKTAAGTPRYRCNTCRKTFAIGGDPAKKQRITHKNREVFALLMNKSPINRMAEITGLDPKVLYGKIDFIHRQCLAFAAAREREMMYGMKLPKMYVAVDRQHFIVNWSSRKDRRNVQLNAIATADLYSGYVLGMNLNFDGSMDAQATEAAALVAGDYSAQPFVRQYARVWLKPDYDASVASSKANATRKLVKAMTKARGVNEVTAEITAQYASALTRDDVEDTDEKDKSLALPHQGMQVHEQYTLHAHFLALSLLLSNAEKVRVYMDQDSGFRAGFMAAFHQRVKERTADGFFVSVLKEASIDQKDAAILKAKSLFKEWQKANPKLSPGEVELEMALDEMDRMTTIGHWGDRWFTHPTPNMGEPDKQICWLSDIDEPIAQTQETNQARHEQRIHFARLYLKGSLHAVERFFMQARRRLSLAERGVPSASTDRRIWHGYSAYKPQNLGKVLELFRVFYNYCAPGTDKQTPAMRLGLARGPVKLEDILYFSA